MTTTLWVWATSQPVFNTQSEFEKYEGFSCERASDGCNTYFMKDGKVAWGTLMACHDHTPTWSCIDYADGGVQEYRYIVVLKSGHTLENLISAVDDLDGAEYEETIFDQKDTKMIVVQLVAPFIAPELEKLEEVDYIEADQIVTINNLTSSVSNSISVHYGEITKIENGADGVQIEVTNSEGVIKSTAVSIISDEIKNGDFDDLLLGTRVKVFYYDSVEAMGLLIGDDIEIVSRGLSDNDKNFFDVLKKDVDSDFQERVNAVIKKYEKKLDSHSVEKRVEINNKLVDRIDEIISKFLMKYPQDIALPKAANDKFLKLEFIKFSFMNLDFEAQNFTWPAIGEKISWEKALEIAKTDGKNIDTLFQAHNLTVEILMKNGTRYVTTEPNIDDFFKLKEACGTACKDLPMATE